MPFFSHFGCKLIFMPSVNFWHQHDSNSLFKGSIGHVISSCKWPIPYVTLLFRDRRVAALLFPGLFRAEIILLCVNRIPIACFLFVPAQKLSGIA